MAGTDMMPTDDEDTSRVPVGRFASTTEVADLAITMIDNSYPTGKVYLLDGGSYPR